VRRYTPDQIRAALAAAEARWTTADWDDAAMWLRSCHRLRDRLALELRLEAIK
jgi:hypothetical protein